MEPDEAEENRKAWFFASCDIRNLDPVAVAAALQLRAVTTGMPQFYEAWRIDRQAADQLVMDLSLAVRAGKIRFERIPERAPPPPPPRLPSPGESEQVAAARQRGPQEPLQHRLQPRDRGGQAPALLGHPKIGDAATLDRLQAETPDPATIEPLLRPQAERAGPPMPDELEHFEKGHFANQGKLEGGGHSHDNMDELQQRGYEELTPDEVRQLRKAQQPFEDAWRAWDGEQKMMNTWRKRKGEFSDSVGGKAEFGPLRNPKLAPEERQQLQARKEEYDAKITKWEAENPAPPAPGKQPKPTDFGLDPEKLLSNRKIFYHERLGETGAEIGGVTSKNPIHTDGHTWFPPGWEAKPIMEALESKAPGVTTTSMTTEAGKVIATKRTAWVRKAPDGRLEVAPPSTRDPARAGYLKSSMIVPADGAQRTLFPEMIQ